MQMQCLHCKKQVLLTEFTSAMALEDKKTDAELGESWMHLTSSTSSGITPIRKENSLPNVHVELERNRKMREIASFGDEPSHMVPLCDSCTNRVVTELTEARNLANEEYEKYTAEFHRLSNLSRQEDLDDAQLKELLLIAEEEEKALLVKSKQLESERGSLRRKMAELHQHAAVLEQMHRCYWRDYNELQLQLRSNERDALRRKIECASQQLEALNKTNVINDAFYISHSDVYGTINGFRLGSIQSQPVEWDEINAAWGQTTLVLQTLATHCDFTFPKYRLVPMGSFSRIIRKDDDKCVLDLHCPSDISFGRLFGYGTFDKGMAAFLECLAVLQDHARTLDSTFVPPYSIQQDRIHDLSIKLQFNTYEKWTKALKYMLTNIKCLIAAASTWP